MVCCERGTDHPEDVPVLGHQPGAAAVAVPSHPEQEEGGIISVLGTRLYSPRILTGDPRAERAPGLLRSVRLREATGAMGWFSGCFEFAMMVRANSCWMPGSIRPDLLQAASYLLEHHETRKMSIMQGRLG